MNGVIHEHGKKMMMEFQGIRVGMFIAYIVILILLYFFVLHPRCRVMSSRLASNNISNRIFNNVSDSIFIDLQIYPVNDDNLQYLR